MLTNIGVDMTMTEDFFVNSYILQGVALWDRALTIYVPHVHFLCVLSAIQNILFRLLLRVSFHISVPQLHAGYKHPPHSYLVGSVLAVLFAATPRGALGFAVQFGLLHSTSRQLLHVL